MSRLIHASSSCNCNFILTPQNYYSSTLTTVPTKSVTATERHNAVNWESKDNLLGCLFPSQIFRILILYCEGGELCPWNKGTSTADRSTAQHSLRLSCSNFPNSLQKNSVGFLSLEYLWHISRTNPEAAEIVQERKGAAEWLQREYPALGEFTGHFKDS